MRILILGGYGVFGGRLAELLSDLPDIELLICGRDGSRADAYCAGYQGLPQVRPMALDRINIAKCLATEQPHLVVDASGPFQDYGADPYHVIKACIDAGVDYVDFADAADFVFGVAQFDAQARERGVFILAGVSSFPVLTAAVLRQMSKTMEIHRVDGGIAPSPYAGIGLNVMRAVVGYAGAPVKLQRHGKLAHGVGLAESLRFTIAVPGHLPLNNIHFSLVDVPDLQVIPAEYPAMTDIWMGAGPVPELLHRILNLLAKTRALLRLPSLEPCSRLFYAVLNRMRFGEHRGGMFVRARGVKSGQDMELSWHLLAEGDDGPYIPSMAIEAVIRKLRDGQRPEPGARSAVRALELADYDVLFNNRRIFTGFRHTEDGAALYRQILGDAFLSLPPQLQKLHGETGARQWTGEAAVRRGDGFVAAIIATLFGFPKAAPRVPVTVTFSPDNGAEQWERNFGGNRFTSLQSRGTGRDQHHVVEKFGMLSFTLALVIENHRLRLIPRRWAAFGVPMPGVLLPTGSSFESEIDGNFAFDVEISVPLVGLVVGYRGTLSPSTLTR